MQIKGRWTKRVLEQVLEKQANSALLVVHVQENHC